MTQQTYFLKFQILWEFQEEVVGVEDLVLLALVLMSILSKILSEEEDLAVVIMEDPVALVEAASVVEASILECLLIP